MAKQLVVGRCMFDPDVTQFHLQFFRDQHRQRSVGALSHFDLADDQRDRSVRPDAYEGAGSEVIGVGGFGIADRPRQTDAQEQISSGGSASLQEYPSGEAVLGQTIDDDITAASKWMTEHVQPPCPLVLICAANLIASRTRTYVPQRQRLPSIAALISASLGRGLLVRRADADMICPD